MLRFYKSRSNAKNPSIGSSQSAGIDFFVPEYTESYKEELKLFGQNIVQHNPIDFSIDNEHNQNFIIVKPHSSIMIPIGLKFVLNKGEMMMMTNKSGIATKQGLVLGACLIDSDYRGEIVIHLINSSNDTQLIAFGQKITQGVILKHETTELKALSNTDWAKVLHEEKETNERNEGGFGSTGI